MKVFFTIDALINAGTEKSILDIVSHFSSKTEVTVIYFYNRHDLKENFQAAGIRLIYLSLSGKRNFREGVRKLTALIKREKPHIVVSSIFRANIISRIACKRTNTQIIGTFISDSYSAERKNSFGFKRKVGAYIYFLLDKFTARIPSAWISNAESIKKSNCLHLNIAEDKVHVIYRGRDSQKFKVKLNQIHQPFRFVFLGRLLETKGLIELVKAFNEVAAKNYLVQLDIYGDGPFRSSLSSLINSTPHQSKIHLHGMVINGWEKLYDADCFVFPSWYEGFSGSLVEAMLVGIPIICSDIPMNLEAVQPNETALVFPVRDVNALQLSMEKSILDYENMKEMAQRAKQIATNRFDIRIIAAQYEQLLHQISNQC